jgi:hypothetical protein
MNVIEPPLFVKYTPDEKGIKECQEFGKKSPTNAAHTNKPL